MENNELVVCDKTKTLLIAAYRLAESIDLMEHALDYVESESPCDSTIDRAKIGSLLAVLKAFLDENMKAFFSAENALSKGGSAECPKG